MLAVVRDADLDKVRADRDRRQLLRRDLRELLALPPAPTDTVAAEGIPPDYCVWVVQARGRAGAWARRFAQRSPVDSAARALAAAASARPSEPNDSPGVAIHGTKPRPARTRLRKTTRPRVTTNTPSAAVPR